MNIDDILEVGESRVQADPLTKDSPKILDDFNAKRIADETSIQAGIVGIGRDISARRARERQLQCHPAFLEAQQVASLLGIVVIETTERSYLTTSGFLTSGWIPGSVIQTADDSLRQYLVSFDKQADPERFITRVDILYDNSDEPGRDEIPLAADRVIQRLPTHIQIEHGTDYGQLQMFPDITDHIERESWLERQNPRLEALRVLSHKTFETRFPTQNSGYSSPTRILPTTITTRS